CQHYYSIPHSC
nr:immunoglobulin light chain junction region [Macaca mulatta]